MADAVLVAVVAVTGVVLTGCAYALLGGPALWGRFRGVPLCGHPFELVAKDPLPNTWTCPKCGTPFALVMRADRYEWRPLRRWGADG